MPPSEDEISLGNEDFIMPEEPLEQERFKQQLIATARSLKRKQQQLQAEQDTLNDRWTQVLAAKEHGLERPTKSYPKRKLLPQFVTRRWSLYRQRIMRLTDHHVAGTKRQPKPNTSPYYPAVKAET